MRHSAILKNIIYHVVINDDSQNRTAAVPGGRITIEIPVLKASGEVLEYV
jgi:hypothetical protein